MNQQQWGAPPGRSGGPGGSVRRARERMEAGLPPESPQAPQQKPYDAPRAIPYQQSQIPRPRPQMPPGLATRTGQGPIGVAISRPTQVPQWPLSGTIENVQDSRSNQQYQPPTGRGNPPQRPPRPSHVPSMLDASRLQEHTPTFQYKPPQQLEQQQQNQGRGQTRYQDEDDDFVTSPLTQSSRPSTISSVGTIPDFPIPMPPPPVAGPRRSANLGPPPTSRRGASSYYSHASYVSPIPEESPRSQPSHGSYASSAAIPSSWGSESPIYDYDEKYDEKDRGFTHDVIEEGRESRESNDNDDTGLIRSASLGKRAKPSIITTKSSERIEPERPQPLPQQKSKLERMGVIDGGIAAGFATGAAMTASRMNNGQRETVWPMVGDPTSPLASGTGLIDKSTSSSETSVPTVARAVTTDDRTPAPTFTNKRADLQAGDMLGAYNAASSLQPGVTSPTRTPSPGYSRLSAIRRPPRLDMDSVRDAEARGSLTSLPDLIRRATRLAAMMDRGRRPASRLALDDFPSESELSRDKEIDLSSDEKRQSGLSGMLAAFPPPGLATPRSGGTPRPVSPWPSPYDDGPPTAGLADQKQKQQGRRCCGLPAWGFLIVLLILLIIIAAAVVVPLELLVIHKPKSSPATKVSLLQECQQDPTTMCQNGGSTFLNSGMCACLCINGFTGSTCITASTPGCTTTTLSNDYSNVTLGDAIPRLISAAQTNFSIPLFATVILAHFNTANLSCLSENALVTFDGLSQRIGTADEAVVPSPTSGGNVASPTVASRRKKRDGTTTLPHDAAASNGIVIDTGTSPVISPIRTTSQGSTSPSATSAASATTPTSAAPSASPTSSFVVTEQVLDFARVAVLFVLQQERLDSAVSAQSSFQRFFSSQTSTNSDASNLNLGNSNTANLIDFSINLGNGSVGQYNSSLTGRSDAKRSIRLWGRA